ncbi:hypothetical protein C0V97_12680 [Asaia sp. W19]|uniref:hypothetical protein n=1 Tax=unclassified Asaia TaxID=2685023 RepID=UPI000F8E948A|nr:hypothetical protein [Asaia sp. W19]RUT25427.1 hypothetical protein C0V97_12680 [Asaia sp. W19]
MKEFVLDPSTLPEIDIVDLAQSGQILRAEQTTPPGGIPAFLTRDDWRRIVHRHATPDSDENALLAAVERAIHRLLDHAATTLAARPAGLVSATLTVKTDLFDTRGETFLSFVRAKGHPVACVVIGTRPFPPVPLNDTPPQAG